MINKVILIGNFGADPEVRYSAGGKAVASFSIATTRKWKDGNGERQSATEWHKIVTFGKLAEIVGQYMKKGTLVWVDGYIQTRKWQDNRGEDKYTTEIVANDIQMLGSRNQQQSDKQDNRDAALFKSNSDGFEDDIPF